MNSPLNRARQVCQCSSSGPSLPDGAELPNRAPKGVSSKGIQPSAHHPPGQNRRALLEENECVCFHTGICRAGVWKHPCAALSSPA